MRKKLDFRGPAKALIKENQRCRWWKRTEDPRMKKLDLMDFGGPVKVLIMEESDTGWWKQAKDLRIKVPVEYSCNCRPLVWRGGM